MLDRGNPYVHFLAHLEVQVREAVAKVQLKFIYLLLEETHTGLEELLHVGIPHETVKNEKRVLLVVVDFERNQSVKVNQFPLLRGFFSAENFVIFLRSPVFLQLFFGYKQVVHDR